VLWHRRLMQHVSAGHREHLVVDVHAVLLGLQRGLVRAACCRTVGGWVGAAHLVARILVDASPVAMVVAAILEVIAVLSGHGQSAAPVSGLRCASWAFGRMAHGARCQSLRRLACGRGRQREDRRSHRAGTSSALTHSMPL
jgi:hypothetical protein